MSCRIGVIGRIVAILVPYLKSLDEESPGEIELCVRLDALEIGREADVISLIEQAAPIDWVVLDPCISPFYAHIEIIAEIKRHFPHIKLLVCAFDESLETICREKGADDFCDLYQLVPNVRSILTGVRFRLNQRIIGGEESLVLEFSELIVHCNFSITITLATQSASSTNAPKRVEIDGNVTKLVYYLALERKSDASDWLLYDGRDWVCKHSTIYSQLHEFFERRHRKDRQIGRDHIEALEQIAKDIESGTLRPDERPPKRLPGTSLSQARTNANKSVSKAFGNYNIQDLIVGYNQQEADRIRPYSLNKDIRPANIRFDYSTSPQASRPPQSAASKINIKSTLTVW